MHASTGNQFYRQPVIQATGSTGNWFYRQTVLHAYMQQMKQQRGPKPRTRVAKTTQKRSKKEARNGYYRRRKAKKKQRTGMEGGKGAFCTTKQTIST